MKTYDIDVHFDASIRMHGIIAESEEQAREIARRMAKEMHLFAEAVEREDAGEKVAECHELTPQELKREEREAVSEFVSEYIEQQTPTECKDIADGYGVNWLEWVGEYEEEWKNKLFGSISNATHPDTAIFERYAQMYARSRWQQVADGLAAQWDKAFSKAKADPEGTRVIVETNEADPSAHENEFGRYYMVDGSESESSIEHAGQWVVIRVDTVTSPYEVHRPNYAAAHGYSDNQTQLACRCENPNNVTRWARKMIDAGRVTDIYADCY